MSARDTTFGDLRKFLDGMLLDARQPIRKPVRPADAHDDIYPEYEREASAADARHQQEREER